MPTEFDWLTVKDGPIFENALLARRTVAMFGGAITFKDYDKAMFAERYYIPLAWCDGWGDPALHKANCDKLCAFAACKIGMLVPLENGYRLGLHPDDIF